MTRTSGTLRVVRAAICERATRECSTSPTMATVRLWNSFVVPDGVHVQQPLGRVGMSGHRRH